MWGIKRGTTLIGQPQVQGPHMRDTSVYTSGINYHADNASSTMEFVKFDYLDSPATTSALTYYAYFTCGSAQTLNTAAHIVGPLHGLQGMSVAHTV